MELRTGNYRSGSFEHFFRFTGDFPTPALVPLGCLALAWVAGLDSPCDWKCVKVDENLRNSSIPAPDYCSEATEYEVGQNETFPVGALPQHVAKRTSFRPGLQEMRESTIRRGIVKIHNFTKLYSVRKQLLPVIMS